MLKIMYYIYALLSLINSDMYIGYSTDLESRLNAHNNGKVKSTKHNRPWKLVYYEAYCSKEDATKREYQLKKSYFKKELKERMKSSLNISSSTVT